MPVLSGSAGHRSFIVRPDRTGLEIVTEAILYKFSLVKILKIHIQMKICEKFVARNVRDFHSVNFLFFFYFFISSPSCQ